MVDGRGQVVIPANEIREVQNQDCFLQRAGRRGGGNRVRTGYHYSCPSPKDKKWLRVTSHSIVGESFTELVDHDEEDAQGVTKATLAKRNTVEDRSVLLPVTN